METMECGCYRSTSLLEMISLQFLGRDFSALRFMDGGMRASVADALERSVSPDAPTLLEYNEALHILCAAPPCETKEAARYELIERLRSA